MGSCIKCFMIVDTNNVEVHLRRYHHAAFVDGKSVRECSHSLNHGYHNASVVIYTGPLEGSGAKISKLVPNSGVHGDYFPHDDPRWPIYCGCGYRFADDDQWQFNPERLYLDPESGAEFTKEKAPAGAILDTTSWTKHFAVNSYEDGKHYECKLPDGVWWGIDTRANNGTPENPGWKRTGAAPDFTVRPSIATSGYHGFLTNGVLEEC